MVFRDRYETDKRRMLLCAFQVTLWSKTRCVGMVSDQVPCGYHCQGRVFPVRVGNNSLSENLWYDVRFLLAVLTAFLPFLSAGGTVLGPGFIHNTCNGLRTLEKSVVLSPAMKESVVFPWDKSGKWWKKSWGNSSKGIENAVGWLLFSLNPVTWKSHSGSAIPGRL